VGARGVFFFVVKWVYLAGENNKRLGAEALQPTRIKYKPLVRA
jgi:hypothetical protein